MAYRADTADTLCDLRHLIVRATFTEFLQTAKLIHVEERLVYLALVIQMYRDPPMTLNSRHGFYR
jgi:hypothetical protein